jgi:hypothetical protein
MVNEEVYQSILNQLEVSISEHKKEVERLMLNIKSDDENFSEMIRLKQLTSDIENALKSKDVDALTKIIKDANIING